VEEQGKGKGRRINGALSLRETNERKESDAENKEHFRIGQPPYKDSSMATTGSAR
jgi:hypothetical protein